MSQIATTPDRAPMNSVAISNGPNGTSIAPQNLGEVVKFAEVMCRADIALPKHLRGNAGACMAVALQALEWQMSPFAVASKSYAVNGAIAYEAQLIAAVVNTRSGIKGRLKYEFLGDGQELSCKVSGVLDGDVCEYETPPIGAITTKNSPLWKSDPRQQLGYFAARSWARRHCPEVILGVYDRDEADHFGPTNAKDVTPSLQERLAASKGEVRPEEGFDRSFVDAETAAITQTQEPSDTPPSSDVIDASSVDQGSGAPPSAAPAHSADEADQPEDGEQAGTVAKEDPAPSSETVPSLTRMVMEELIDSVLREATGEPASERITKIDRLRDVFLLPENLGAHERFVRLCHETARRVAEAPAEKVRARDFLTAKLPAAEGGA